MEKITTQLTKEQNALNYVIKNAKQGNPDSVLNHIDAFASKNWMMNIGNEKGIFLTQAIITHNPKIAVELGTYCGYSAILIAKNLPKEGFLFSIEISAGNAALAQKMIEFAGLKEKVKILIGTVQNQYQVMKSQYKIDKIDLLFIDHDKQSYLSDFLYTEENGFLQPGSVIVADNIYYPGAPDFLKHMSSNKNYNSQLFEGHLEYNQEIKDAVLVSVKIN